MGDDERDVEGRFAEIYREAEQKKDKLRKQWEKTREADLAAEYKALLMGKPEHNLLPPGMTTPKPALGERLKEVAAQNLEKRQKTVLDGIDRQAREKTLNDREAVSGQAQQSRLDSEEKRAQFEQWATDQRNALQSRQTEQRGTDGEHWAQRRQRTEDQIEKQYGEGKREQEKRLAKLIEKHERGSWLSRAVGRVRGEDSEREALQKNLTNIRQREQEMRTSVEKQQRGASAMLDDLHREQRQELEQRIELGRSEGYSIPSQELERERPRSRERDRGMERDFHSRDRK